MPKEEKNKLTGKESWIRFRNRVSIALGIFALITLYLSFYFVGPISGKVVDAKTGKPIAGIGIGYLISGDDLFCLNPGGCNGWGKGTETYTDDNGKFKIPFSIAFKFPFLQWLTNRHISASDKYDQAGNKNYDSYEEDFLWFPFMRFTFKLVPVPKTLDDCRDNLTEKEQYRCVKMLADRDAREINKLKYNYDYGSMDNYFLSKYLHILENRCEGTQNLPSTNRDFACDAVLAAIKQDKNMCNNDKYCFYSGAIDLKDKTWCRDLPLENDIKDIYDISREKCEYIIDALTEEDK